jgi:spore coat-associated protein N
MAGRCVCRMALRLAFAPTLVVLALVSAAPLGASAPVGSVRAHGFAHGSLELAASRQGAILAGRNLMPGDRVSGAITIANTGTMAGAFTLSGLVRGSGRLAEELVLIVRERAYGVDSLVYAGSLAGLRAVKLGLIGPAQARTFRFSVRVPASAERAVQGLRTSADFSWTAVQAS